MAPALVARIEARVLAECGFALDLDSCAATGVREDLIYVSPKCGRAVSAAAGAEWRDRLLPLPAFLRGGETPAPGPAEIADAFRLTGFFLDRDLFAPRGLPLPDFAPRLPCGGDEGGGERDSAPKSAAPRRMQSARL